MTTAFQADAFQTETLAFQIDVDVVAEVRKPKDNRRTRTPLFVSAAEEDEERKRLAELKAAREALEREESAALARDADVRRVAVRAVFDLLRDDEGAARAEAAEQAALDATRAAETQARQTEYQAALAATDAEIERLTKIIAALVQERRRQRNNVTLALLLAN